MIILVLGWQVQRQRKVINYGQSGSSAPGRVQAASLGTENKSVLRNSPLKLLGLETRR